METKRCVYCHKLQHANARLCSGCGHPFAPRLRVRSASRQLTRLSLPPASPHQVGHYSGLHPEDQPYQSSMITAQRSVQSEVASRPEPERIMLPMTSPAAHFADVSSVAFPTEVESQSGSGKAQNSFLPGHAISVLLTISCLFFLLGSSILAFVLMGQHAPVANVGIGVNPGTVQTQDTFKLSGRGFGADSLMVFTYDKNGMFFNENGYPLETHTDSQGNFALLMHVPGQWRAGTHLIHVTDEAEKLSVSTRIIVR